METGEGVRSTSVCGVGAEMGAEMGADWRSEVNDPLEPSMKGRNAMRTCCMFKGVRFGVLN